MSNKDGKKSSSGKTSSGKTPSRKTSSGKTSSGKTPSGKTSSGKKRPAAGEEELLALNKRSNRAVLDDKGHVDAMTTVGRDMCEPKAAGESLQIFKQAVESASDAIGMSTKEGRHYFQNRRFSELFGDIGDNPRTNLYTDRAVGEEVFATIMDGRTWTGEVKMNSADGGILDIYLRAYSIKDEHGNVIGLVGIHTDMTEYKKTQRKLAEHQELLRSAFESIQDGISILNPDLTVRHTNEVMRRWYKDNLPLEGKPCYTCYHNKAAPCDPCPTLRCIQTGETERDVIPGLAGSDVKWVELFSYPIRDRQTEEVTGVVEFVRNITERKLAENSLKTEKERLAVTLRSIGDAVITTDTEGGIVLMNRVAENLTGWSQEDAAGQPLDDVLKLIHEFSRKRIDTPIKQVLKKGETVELSNHTVLVARDGTERIIADSGAPIKDTCGKTIGVVLVFRDMTEKQRLLDAVQKNQKLQALGVLAAGIAHDFNNLLGGVFGFVDLAIEEVKNNDTAVEMLSRAMDAMDRARSLTGQLLTFAKGGEPIRKPGRLQPFMEETARFALSGTAVSHSIVLPENLWKVDYDRNQLGQVLDNILINARQAMPKGGTVHIRGKNTIIGNHPTLPAGSYVQFSITDTGIGIPAEFIQNIFDPFFSTKAEGHGLGLASSYSIIQQHEGAIEAESEPGKGTTFHIYLPAVEEEFTTENGLESVSSDGGGGWILVMDDEPVIRNVLSKILKRLGYEVETASEGEEALGLFRRYKAKGEPFTAVIVDMTVIGGMGGTEFLEALREYDKDTPVFVTSGYSSDPALASPQKHGFQGGLAKPFRMCDVEKMLSEYFCNSVHSNHSNHSNHSDHSDHSDN